MHIFHVVKWWVYDTYHKSSEIDIKVTMNARHEPFQCNSCFTNELKLKRVFIKHSQTKSLHGGVGLSNAMICQRLIPLWIQCLVYCLGPKFRRLKFAHIAVLSYRLSKSLSPSENYYTRSSLLKNLCTHVPKISWNTIHLSITSTILSLFLNWPTFPELPVRPFQAGCCSWH